MYVYLQHNNHMSQKEALQLFKQMESVEDIMKELEQLDKDLKIIVL